MSSPDNGSLCGHRCCGRQHLVKHIKRHHKSSPSERSRGANTAVRGETMGMIHEAVQTFQKLTIALAWYVDFMHDEAIQETREQRHDTANLPERLVMADEEA